MATWGTKIVTWRRLFSHPTVLLISYCAKLIDPFEATDCLQPCILEQINDFSSLPCDRWWNASPGVGGECPSRQTCRNLPDLILSGSITRAVNKGRPPLCVFSSFITLKPSFSGGCLAPLTAVEICYVLCLKKSQTFTFSKRFFFWRGGTLIQTKTTLSAKSSPRETHKPTQAQGWFSVLLLCACNLSHTVWTEPRLMQQPIIVLQSTQSETRRKKKEVMRGGGGVCVCVCVGSKREVGHRCFSIDQPLTNNGAWIEGQRRRPLIFFPPPSHLILGRVILSVTQPQTLFSVPQIPALDLCPCSHSVFHYFFFLFFVIVHYFNFPDFCSDVWTFLFICEFWAA